MNDPRIRMDTSSAERPPGVRSGRSPLGIAAIIAVMSVGFGLLTTRAPMTEEQPSADGLDAPVVEAGFHSVTPLDGGPWEPFRIDGAYLYRSAVETYSVITDDDRVFEVSLPGIDVLFGAIATDDGSLAFGTAHGDPAVWRSSGLRHWELERLPWDGLVRAAAHDRGRTRLIGIRSKGTSFEYLVAVEKDGAWLIDSAVGVPDASLVSVPGGFVSRGRASEGTGYGYVFSTDGLFWAFQSALGVGVSRTAGQIPAFALDDSFPTQLRLAGDDREFEPPAWPISGAWIEGDIVWLQTPTSAWASTDTSNWTEYPIGPDTGVPRGFSVLLPVGNVARIAVSGVDGVSLMRWQAGTDS